MSDNGIQDQKALSAFETEELRIRQQELEVKLKELELQGQDSKDRRAWFRNPAVISGAALLYATVATSFYSDLRAGHESERKYALEYTKLAVQILESPPQQHKLTEWASDVLKHFADAPFDISVLRTNPEFDGQKKSDEEQ